MTRTVCCFSFVALSCFASRVDADETVTSDNIAEHRRIVPNRDALQPTPMVRLPLGSVRPTGWLERQLRLQADGLTGRSEELYQALRENSGWLGGDGESWERTPYYVRGLIALAHTLDDPTLIERTQRWVDWTLQSQTEDGFFGPESNDDWWPRMVAIGYLRDHYEATGDERVLPFLTAYFEHQLANLPDRPLRDWGRARAADNIDVVLWTYNRTGDERLLKLAKILRAQAYPWTRIYGDNLFYAFGGDFHPQHIVNVSQGLKMPPVSWQISGDESDRSAYARGLNHLQRQYGRGDGQISGTEMLSGLRSTDGVELCADVERIVSDGITAVVLGDPAAAESMERIAYNSLPAHTTSDLKQITYYQFPNQIACTNEPHGFEQDYSNANVPGPYSGFPCCCYNWHIGWPKFVQHMWAATSDGGLALLAYGPNQLTATVADGVDVDIEQVTDYPFTEDVRLIVDPERETEFPLVLRIPSWCDQPPIRVNGQATETTAIWEELKSPDNSTQSGRFVRIERRWQSGDEVTLRLPMPIFTTRWVNQSVAIHRGPLLFSFPIDAEWSIENDYEDDFDEYELRPTEAWNYALAIDPDSPSIDVTTLAPKAIPYDLDEAPVRLRVNAKRLPNWNNAARKGQLMLGRMDGGWNPLQSAAVPVSPDQSHRIRVVYQQGRLSVFVDDFERALLSRPIDLDPKGLCGLRLYNSSAKFSNISFNEKAIDPGSQDENNFGGTWRISDGLIHASSQTGAKRTLPGTRCGDAFEIELTILGSTSGDSGLMLGATDVTDQTDGFNGAYIGFRFTGGEAMESSEPPPSPVVSTSPIETIELIPYGATKTRISYFPVAKP